MNNFNLTDEQLADITHALINGTDLNTAAYAAGVEAEELVAFLELASGAKKTEQREKAKKILLKIKEAKAKNIQQAHEVLNASFVDDWKAVAWYLERILPEVYGGK